MALAKKSKEIPGALSLWGSEEKTNNDVCGKDPVIGFNALESSENKKGDWRFENYQFLRSKDREKDEQKELIWIGTVDLNKISERSSSVPILFLENGKMRNDYAIARFEDGFPHSNAPVNEYEFNVSSILDVLLEAKKNGFSYFHVLLKETVDRRGRHFISLLRNENETDEHYCGIPSKVDIPEMDYQVIREYDHINLNNYEEETILFNDEYRWMK